MPTAPPPHRIFNVRPHASLSDRGFFILMAFVSAISLGVGAFFAALGAWPIFGFYGLEIVMLYLAFRWNYYRARRNERIEISAEQVVITQTQADGTQNKWQAHPYWLRLDLLPPAHRADEIGALAFSSRGEYVHIGAFLAADEKRALHAALRDELRAVAHVQN